MRRTLNKLRRTSMDELRVRGSQAMAAFCERRSWSSQTHLPDDGAFLQMLDPKFGSVSALRDHFRDRATPRFFGSFADPAATISNFRRRWPHSETRIVEQADRVLTGHFELLGWHDLFFGDPIDWQLEPVSGRRAPLVHWSKLNYLDADVAGDKKIVWELNRHQHFVLLGQAYWLTGDERYAAGFVAQLNSWMEENPPKLGINWASSLEVAFRSIAWLWALSFFKHAQSLSSETFLKALKFLRLNGRHLETYLSTYFSPNTHLTGEALGLFYLGILLPEFADSPRWKKTGLSILTQQLERHVQGDGVYFEQSSYYHRYTTDFLIHLLLLLRANDEKPPAGMESKLLLLLDHLQYITRPDGSSPLFGDDDGGRLVKLDQRAPNDFRAALSTGAAMFSRADYKFVAGEVAEETFWLMGPSGLAEFDTVIGEEPVDVSVAFKSAGYYVMRDGWSATANYLLFDCGPHGVANCGHAHADALSFELAANGRTMLVDPGTYTYTGSKEMRDWFRGSTAHNTLTIDGKSSSAPAGPFSWQTVAGCAPLAWLSQKRFDYVAGAHDGYSRLSNPAAHWRDILFLKSDYWVMRDRVESAGYHYLEFWFNFAVAIGPLHTKNDSVQVISDNDDGTRLQITTLGRGGSWARESGWVSTCYGEKRETPVFVFSLAASGSAELVTFLLPRASGAVPLAVVREIDAVNGRAFEINTESHHDILLIRHVSELEFGLEVDETGRVETARITSDFEITWARFANEKARVPDELVLIGGRRLEFEGRRILEEPRRVDYVVMNSVEIKEKLL